MKLDLIYLYIFHLVNDCLLKMEDNMKASKVILLITIIFIFTGCGANETEDTANASSNDIIVNTIDDDNEVADDSSDELLEEDENDDVISADKKLFSVEVTLPSAFFEDSTNEEIEEAAKESGIDKVEINENGSVTYKMSKAKHSELMDEIKVAIDESIEEILADKETYPSFGEITYNKDLSEFTIKCDTALYSEFDSFVSLTFYIQGIYYQAFDGVKEDNQKVIVNFVDMDTGEVLNVADSSQVE